MTWVTQIAKQAGYRAALVVGVLEVHFPEPAAPPVIFLSQHEPSPSRALLHLARLARHPACLDLEQPYSFTRSRGFSETPRLRNGKCPDRGVSRKLLDYGTENVQVCAEPKGR